jgi:pyridoxamine 5'-phosphate oxidase
VSDVTPDPLADIRRSYDRDTLDEARAAADPFAQFKSWLDDALAADLLEPNAMTLATIDANGHPAARIVLLRGWDPRGFVFFTNYVSQKGREIGAHPSAALLFYWDKLERQVRINGAVEKLRAEESDAYFERRPRGHRISAWASPQSQVIPSRAVLEERMAATDRRFEGVEVPRPPHWGGYCVKPDRFEFWQGRPDRAHDRLVYTLNFVHNNWTRDRLAP